MTVGTAVAALLLAMPEQGSSVDGDAFAALRAHFGQDIEYEAAPRQQIRYCPDNTCEAFKASRRASTADLADFALLYLWAVSDYTLLEPWQQGPTPPSVAAAVQRHDTSCPSQAQRERVACVLRTLAKAVHATVSFVRYDEGTVAEEPIDLERELRRQN